MEQKAYFDTDAFHHIAQTFSAKALESKLRDKLLLSPITGLEVLSHLTWDSKANVSEQLHSLRNIMNPSHAGILPWPDVAIAANAFRITKDDGGFIERLGEAINICLEATSRESLKEPAVALQKMLEQAKDEIAGHFERLLQAARNEGLSEDDHRSLFAIGTAKRVGADPSSRSVDDVIWELSAYYELEREKLKVAIANKYYNPEKHRNDALDVEQLVYLSDATLHFITCDGGFERARPSPQFAQIHITAAAVLRDAAKATELLAAIIG
jgi:hypothetical protein